MCSTPIHSQPYDHETKTNVEINENNKYEYIHKMLPTNIKSVAIALKPNKKNMFNINNYFDCTLFAFF